jgi:enterochelin esterase-like enzyme
LLTLVIAAATVETVRSRTNGIRSRTSGTRSQATHASAPAQLSISCRSPSLGGTAPVIVYLPAGYRRGSARYRVIYFLHGLPASRTSYTLSKFVGDAVSTGRQAAIVVAPEGARSADEDHEYLDLGATENWPKAIAHDIPRCIDSRFRTVTGRTGRALVGLSAGGYGAFNVGLRNLGTFGAVESWSGYFAATDPSGDRFLDLGSPQANAMARVPRGPGLKAATKTHPTFIGFYAGRQDSRFLDVNVDFDRSLNQQRIPHRFRTYPGGHSWALWRGQARRWLGYALSALAAGA